MVAGSRVIKYGGPLVGDVDGSGRVDGVDLQQLSWSFGSSGESERYREPPDLDRNGVVDGGDLAILAASFGNS